MYNLTKELVKIYYGVFINKEPKYVAGFICTILFIVLTTFISYHIWNIDRNNVKVKDDRDDWNDKSKIDDFYKELAKQQQEDKFLEGSTERYEWKQNEKEIDIYIPVDDNMTSKSIKVDFKNNRVDVYFSESIKLSEETFEEIIPYECVWQLENNNNHKCLWITIVKKLPTNQKGHWKGVFKADIDYTKINDKNTIYSIDKDDPDALKKAVKDLKERIKEKNIYT